MKIDIICPLYKAEEFIVNLNNSLLKQENVTINSINYILTESNDRSEELLKKNKCSYEVIKRSEFSHSLVRENAAMKCSGDILVFITQDIDIRTNNWLERLVAPIISGEAEASYSRQLTKFNNIEKYTRECNYPDVSVIKTRSDIPKMGLKTFFFSDACSAIKESVFKELEGYDHKNLPISEDMYIAYKLIMNDYRIKYCADSVVYHSHDFTLKELYERYKLTGKFFKEYSYIDKYGTNKSGGSLAKYILKRAIQDKNIKVLFRFVPDMFVRFVGMKVGKNL